MGSMQGDRWKKIRTVLRIIFGAGLLYLLLRFADPAALRLILTESLNQWPWVLAGLVMTFLGLLVGAFRWREVLEVQRIHYSRGKIFNIYFIGQFFNAFMLGACGGDMARAFYVARGQQGRRAEAVATIFVDRGIGLFTMIVFCCVMIVARLPLFLDNDGPRDTGLLMVLFLLGAVGGIVALFRKNLFEHFDLFRRAESSMRLGSLIRRAYDAFFLYRAHPRVLAVAVVYSLLNLAFLTLACFCFGRALGIPVSILDYFTLFPIVSVISAIPLTPGSLGVREGLFVTLFRAVLVSREHAILLSLMVYGGSLVWSLVGGLFYISPAAHAGFPHVRDWEAWSTGESANEKSPTAP